MDLIVRDIRPSVLGVGDRSTSVLLRATNLCETPRLVVDGEALSAERLGVDTLAFQPPAALVTPMSDACEYTRDVTVTVDCAGGTPSPGLVYGEARASGTLSVGRTSRFAAVIVPAPGEMSPWGAFAIGAREGRLLPSAGGLLRVDGIDTLSGAILASDGTTVMEQLLPPAPLEAGTTWTVHVRGGDEGPRDGLGRCSDLPEESTFVVQVRKDGPAFRAEVSRAPRTILVDADDVGLNRYTLHEMTRLADGSFVPGPVLGTRVRPHFELRDDLGVPSRCFRVTVEDEPRKGLASPPACVELGP